MINRYDNFTKLREIVLGSVNRSMLDVVDKKYVDGTMEGFFEALRFKGYRAGF